MNTKAQIPTSTLHGDVIDLPEFAEVPSCCFDQDDGDAAMPGEVAVRTEGGRISPVRPEACPAHPEMSAAGVTPVCASQGEGACCTAFGGQTRRGTAWCAELHHQNTLQQPMVALVALQKREKLPPPMTH